MKKSQTELLIDTFRARGWKATLGELLEDGRFTFAHKLTARISDMRKLGFHIDCDEAKAPTDNLYKVTHRPEKYGGSATAAVQGVESASVESASTVVDKGGQVQMDFAQSPWSSGV